MSRAVIRIVLFAVAVAVLAIGVFLVSGRGAWTPPDPRPPELQSSIERRDGLWSTAPVTLDEIAARPLFSAGRRPVSAPVAQPEAIKPPEPDPFPDAELVGIFGSGADAGVMLRDKDATRRVGLGTEWSGWTLRSIDVEGSSAVFVAQGRGEHELRMKRAPQQGTLLFTPPSRAPADSSREVPVGKGGEPREVVDEQPSRAEEG